ncbi:MAG TPA: cupin domain-containing protein [Chloroflexus aurantiacus]|jgi:quercetin dioxygenase-like cupin family protein|uniref:Cupin 2 conserved barrel domain protein n=1 Tax=Chloroflexus aurantiacus (strain ATCC 29366 / DSM 635 / J-10-fl) TaxID=324602 RepID=A9WD09_CHLAA|nr:MULTISPECIES: cupin domain-containing protein [Chloroflexus]ABY33578.1 Cupin 2 conserved barrel domain protein [Chloroflexus aurantiacus J-10-fl]HBW67203.1 cupin domain-containing protein [Chloroflexus aurantiacus]
MNPATVRHVLEQISIPDDSTISRTIYQDDQIKAVLFGFAAGQELSEHTAATPAIMHFVQGEARVTLGQEVVEAKPGTWVHMPAHLPHSIQAHTPVIMLLLLLRGTR